MFKIEITGDTADALFRDILVADYRRLLKDIAELEARGELAEYQQADLDDTRRYAAAMAIMMEYYIADHEREEILKAVEV
jgi:hypothetical protein